MLCRLFVGSDDKTIMHELTNKDENSCIRGGISFYNADGVGLIRMRRMIMIVVMMATNYPTIVGVIGLHEWHRHIGPQNQKAQRYHSV